MLCLPTTNESETILMSLPPPIYLLTISTNHARLAMLNISSQTFYKSSIYNAKQFSSKMPKSRMAIVIKRFIHVLRVENFIVNSVEYVRPYVRTLQYRLSVCAHVQVGTMRHSPLLLTHWYAPCHRLVERSEEFVSRS